MVRAGYLVGAAALVLFALAGARADSSAPWQEQFAISSCNFVTSGRNPYFVLEPGFQLVYRGEDVRVHVTVLDEIRTLQGVPTRAVEEREWRKDKLHEVSRKFYAICEQTKDVLFFGEEADVYEDERLVRRKSGWFAGDGANRVGLAMPGSPKVGMRYYEEWAPGVAMDRAEIVSLHETCVTLAGTFKGCMKVREGSALKPEQSDDEFYAPGVGMVRDEDLELIGYGVGAGQK